ncbi:uncharacterized protein L201_000346 [Kwoniella dendrophila CBS 6074]|uniref:Up-regulated during septation protein 1 domain-containing protein n=1 Tax=Kwoniella dendrophila CBS 6074 TaxID=1295534 RepID=A0AAX4JL23_9TREE
MSHHPARHPYRQVSPFVQQPVFTSHSSMSANTAPFHPPAFAQTARSSPQEPPRNGPRGSANGSGHLRPHQPSDKAFPGAFPGNPNSRHAQQTSQGQAQNPLHPQMVRKSTNNGFPQDQNGLPVDNNQQQAANQYQNTTSVLKSALKPTRQLPSEGLIEQRQKEEEIENFSPPHQQPGPRNTRRQRSQSVGPNGILPQPESQYQGTPPNYMSQQHQIVTPISDRPRMTRQSSMPPMHPAHTAWEDQSRSDDSVSQRSSMQSRQSSPEATLAESVHRGRSASMINGRRLPVDEWQDQNQMYSDSFRRPDRYKSQQEAAPVPSELAELLEGQNVYEAMRIKDEWYPQAFSRKGAEINRLSAKIMELKQAIQHKSGGLAQANSFAQRTKEIQSQKDLERAEVDRIEQERYDNLTKLMDQNAEEMKNFRSQEVTPVADKLNDLATTFTTIRSSLSGLKEEIIESSKTEVKVAKRETAQLKEKLGKLETKLEHYEGAIAPALQKLDGAMNESRKGDETDHPGLDALVRRNTELSDKLITAEKELVIVQQAFEKAQKAGESYESLIEEYLNLLKQKGCDGSDPRIMLSELEEKHRGDIKDLKNRYATELENEKLRVKKAISMIEELQMEAEKNETALSEHESLIIQVAELKEKAQQLEASIKEAYDQKSAVEDKHEGCSTILQETKARLAETERTVLQLRNKVSEVEQQDLKYLKNELKTQTSLLKQVSSSAGFTKASDTSLDVITLQGDLQACRQELEMKTVKLEEYEKRFMEDPEAAIDRYRNGQYTASELRLVQWAENGQKGMCGASYPIAETDIIGDFEGKERTYKNNIKSIEKLKTEIEAKDKEIKSLAKKTSAQESNTKVVNFEQDSAPSMQQPAVKSISATSSNEKTEKAKRYLSHDADEEGCPSRVGNKKPRLFDPRPGEEEDELWDELEFPTLPDETLGDNNGKRFEATEPNKSSKDKISEETISSDLTDHEDDQVEESIEPSEASQTVFPPISQKRFPRTERLPSESGTNNTKPSNSKPRKPSSKGKSKKDSDDDYMPSSTQPRKIDKKKQTGRTSA